jgi:hypothetical protein
MKLQQGLLAMAVVAACAATPWAGEAPKPDEEGISLTVYSGGQSIQDYSGERYYDPASRSWIAGKPGWGVVKVRRKMPLKEGANVVRFQDVASTIDPTSVLVTSLTDPKGTYVLEQNYEYDLVNADKLLERYVDRPLAVAVEGAEVRGELLNFDEQSLVLRTADEAQPIRVLTRPQNVREVRFSALPGGLLTRPTLVWHLRARKEGEHLLQATYHASQISWKADYTATISGDEKSLDLAAWVTLENRSGTGYPNARLKLIAGDVQRVLPASVRAEMERQRAGKPTSEGRVQFEEQSFFEYHLYTLDRAASLEDKSSKQIELFKPVSGVPVGKRLVYYGGRGTYSYGTYNGRPIEDRNFGVESSNKVDIYLEFKNEKDAGMGLPLPAGRVRVYKRDPADKAMEFIGEDEVDHTPKDEVVRLRMGSAFDVTGERRQTNFECRYNEHWLTESFEIKIRNHKTEAVEVLVQEDLYRWINAEVTACSHQAKRLTPQRIVFPAKVEKDGEVVLTYTVRYTW